MGSEQTHLYGWALMIVAVFCQRGHESCPEEDLEKREEEANVVLTGTVEEIMNMDPVHNTYSCKVRVWRYLKGKTMVNGEVLLDGENKVMIGGFGDPEVCDNQVATGDTRIFFVNLAPEFMWPTHKNELMLNSSLMRITLRNLEEVEHCVDDKPVHFTPAQPPDDCRGMLCGFGSVCERDAADPSKTECVCKKMVCPSVVAPVCGSDSSTYSNECELEKAQCNTQRRIKVLRKGPCALEDPCSEVTCSYGSTCIQSSDSLSAKCMCPLSCDGKPEQVVCGSDGQDYRNECELYKQACHTQKNFRLQHQGYCNPCKDSENSLNVACRVEPRTRQPLTFAPPESCPPVNEPLCASDSQTYESECHMTRTGMQKGIELRKIHPGSCKKQEMCKVECKFNGVCQVERLGVRCSCEPIQCDGTYKPLCGKDGRSYVNDCERRRAECLAKAHIPVKQQGPCDLHAPSPCLAKACEFGAVCVVKNDKPVCECPEACLQTPDPVCGSDGHSYGSHCEMRATGCALQREIHIQHRGPCDETCANCSFGAICDGQSGSCVCPQECVESHQPVCGSDGSTYDSECELHVRACTKQLDLRVLAQGECKTCGSAVCAWGAQCIQNKCECTQCQGQAFSPVCGSDGMTYDNTCELGLASCVLKKKIEVAKLSSCEEECGSGGSASGVESCEQDRCRTFGGSWDEDTEDDRCVCDFDCNRVPRNLVCGSDGKTYSNECEMKKASCERQRHLLIQNHGPCTAISATSPPERTAPQRCIQSVYGCCRDNKTAALGVGLAGCTSTCQCNPYGSYKGTCDPGSGQCSCKPGVGGQKCDRCDPGFWNFRGIVTENLSGCTPCNCDAVGSVRDDCEQMSGLCSCKTGVKGMKCNVCPDGSKMGRSGCDTGADAPTSCNELDCKFGASCVEVNGQAHCECPSPDCDEMNKTKVCGSDGVTYADQCQLSTIACRRDKHIRVEHFGQCADPTAAATTIPTAEDRSSCDNTPFGCCPDGKTASSSPEGAKCPSTMRFSGFLHLDQVEGQEVFYTPEMEDPKSELFGETARSIESALNELFCKSEVQKDFMSVQVRSLAPSNSILAFIEAHFNPETRFTVQDIEGALLKQLKAAKETAIVVKKPEEENIRFNNYGLFSLPYFTTSTTATATTPTASTATSTMLPPPNSAFITRRPLGTTRRPYTSRRTTAAPSTMAPIPTTTITPLHRTSPVPHYTKAQQPCDSHPCRHGGTCEDDGADFTCICPAGRGGAVCEKLITYFIPSFGGKSYLAFDTMRAYHTVRIAMEFRVAEMTGILLFNGQDGKKDFLSLTLVNGKVELKFNTGSGTGTLVSKVQVKLGRWYQLVVTRNRRNAVLSVDDELHIEGASPPGTDGLNLDTHLFIGGVPEDMMTDVKERTSTGTGLVGCVRTLDVNNLVYNLQEKGGNVLYGTGVGECGNNPCQPNPCKNSASCQVKEAEMFHCKCINSYSGPTCADTHNPCEPNRCHPSSQCQVQPEGGYKCECPMGREGLHCEQVSDKKGAYMPFFSGDSYLELKGLHTYGHNLHQKVSMTVVLMANESNGMIFYNGQKTDGKGDFISLSLNDGILEFRYDLGKGPAVIRSKDKIKMGMWNTVNLERASRKGEININGKDPVRGESPNQHTALNLKESLFVGGAPDFSRQARAASLKDGFKGAIQKITLMGTPILRQENALHSSDVAMFKGHPCSWNPCHNGGLCNPMLESYECVCPHGFTGTACQNSILEKSAGESESIAFDGRTFIEYHNAVTKSEKALQVNKFELTIKTEATQGLVLWSGKGVERSDYIALAIVDGRVQMTYDLGSKPVVLRSTVRVNTNSWICVKASRARRNGSLQVGNEAAVTGSSPLTATQLDTDGALWLGGLEELMVAHRLPKAYSTGFVGCVKNVVVDGMGLHLVEDALNSPKILHCSSAEDRK
ncbi:agrin-like isoform X4 [Oncorhynchus keta]|uniref:agrin-like isoform X4 n=1 Tax=Oncorhynchus keta TaxID=8018 RepID=UPI00227A77B7|nr:agrin-like isoform X4 [Oncorhynchus keta]